MVDERYKYLISQGWSEADAKKFVRLQELGKSPAEAYNMVKEGTPIEEAPVVRKSSQPTITQKIFGKSKPSTILQEDRQKSYRKVYIKHEPKPKESSEFKDLLSFLGQVGQQARKDTERRYGGSMFMRAPTPDPTPKKIVRKKTTYIEKEIFVPRKGGGFTKQKRYINKIVSTKKKAVKTVTVEERQPLISMPPFAVRRVKFF